MKKRATPGCVHSKRADGLDSHHRAFGPDAVFNLPATSGLGPFTPKMEVACSNPNPLQASLKLSSSLGSAGYERLETRQSAP